MGTDEDCPMILNELEERHFKTKETIIKWYNENPSADSITSKYHDTYIPSSPLHTKDFLNELKMDIERLINSLKISGFIK